MKRNSRYSFMKVADFGWDCFEFYYHLIRLERAKIWNCIKYVNSAEEFSLLTGCHHWSVSRSCAQSLHKLLWVLTKARFLLMITYKLQMNRNPSHLISWMMLGVCINLEKIFAPHFVKLKTLLAPAGSVVWFYLQLQSQSQSSAWYPGMLVFN